MFNSSMAMLRLATVSAALASLSFWWWASLPADVMHECLGGKPAAGVDCRHDLQFNAGLLFTALTLLLLLLAGFRAMRRTRRPAS